MVYGIGSTTRKARFRKRKAKGTAWTVRKGKTVVRVNQPSEANYSIPVSKTGVQMANRTFTLRYVRQATLTSVAGSTGNYVYRANSIFDPDYTGAGGQPLFHDQLAALYNHYLVKKSRIRVYWDTDASANVAINTVYGIRLDDDGSAAIQLESLLEGNRTVWRLGHNCPLYNDQLAQNRCLTMTYTPKGFFGKTRKNNDDLGALFGANPSEVAFFYLFYAQYPPTANNTSVYATVCIDFTIECSEPKDLDIS